MGRSVGKKRVGLVKRVGLNGWSVEKKRVGLMEGGWGVTRSVEGEEGRSE